MVQAPTMPTLDLAIATGRYQIAAEIGLPTTPERMRANVDDLVRVPA